MDLTSSDSMPAYVSGSSSDSISSLFSSDDSVSPKVPAYVGAADNHNLGNVGGSWFDIDPTNIPKFAAVSVLSGVNSFYNTGVKVGNFLGGDFEQNDTQAWISSLDSNLGQYYGANKTAADLTGFLATSLIPGLAGVKILNMGQKALAAADAGYVGSNLGLALGLRTPQIETMIATSANEIRQGQAVFAGISQTGIKALATGAYQNVLEGLAFETAVQATMQASPILDGQSKSDVLFNLATGGLLGGAIGGTLEGVSTLFSIKKGVQALDAAINPSASRALIQETNSPANEMILRAHDIETRVTPDNPGDPNYLDQVKANNARQVRDWNDQRASVNQMSTNTTIGNMVADHLSGMTADDLTGAIVDTDQIAQLNQSTRVEAAMKAAQNSTGTIPENLKVQYWKVAGDSSSGVGVGDVLSTRPLVYNLADRFAATDGQTIRQQVLDYVRGQDNKISDLWDASKAALGENGHMDAEARYIWAEHSLSEVPEGSTVHQYDFPVLQKALADGQTKLNVVDGSGKLVRNGFGSTKELQDFIVQGKQEAQAELQKRVLKNVGGVAEQGTNPEIAGDWTNQKIGKITDTPVSTLEQTGTTGDPSQDYFARSQQSKRYAEMQQQLGQKAVKGEEADPSFLPTWAKVTKNVSTKVDLNGNEVDGYTYAMMQQKLFQDDMSRVVAKQMGAVDGGDKLAQTLPPITQRDLATADSAGTGSSFFTINNPAYDTLASKVSQIGSVTSKFMKAMQDQWKNVSDGPMAALARNQEAAIEWSTINQKASRSALQFKSWVDPDDSSFRGLFSKAALKAATGEDGNIDRDLLDQFLEDPTNRPVSGGASLHHIPVSTDQAWDLLNTHMDQSDIYTGNRNERGSAAGYEQAREIGVFRPIPADPKDYPFFAFVKDPKVTDQGHTSMLFAQSADELQQLAQKAQQARPDLEIHYKSDTAAYFEARGSYDYDRTLSENSIDSSLRNAGVYSNYFTKTDPESIVQDFMNYHQRQLAVEAREIVRSNYQAPFDWLEDQAKAFSRVDTSKFGGNFAALEASAQNPYLSYIKTALNISRAQENPLWYGFNKMLDSGVSRAVDTVKSLWNSSGSGVSSQDLENINAALQKYGMNTGYYDAATNGLVNAQATKGALSTFVRGANAVLSRLVVTLDPLNAVVHSLGVAALRTTELTQLTDAVKSGNTEIAGRLAQISHIDATGQGDMFFSPAKLMAGALKDWFGDDRAAIVERYQDMGIMSDKHTMFSQLHAAVLDDLAVTAQETAADLNSKLSAAMAKVSQLTEIGEKYSGATYKEAFNRFISARSSELLTQPGVDAGLFTQAEQGAYMNTFVNRVEGNMIASQRPGVFQGPLGQAIGLFQAYHFNVMQQMFRYIAEGSTKDAAMLMGLQGTFFGAQSLPAFQAINQHIIGNASGNTNHTDAYDAATGVLGKNLGDLLMYGLPSKLLGANIYSRGDLNPRSVTVLPTTPEDIPFVSAFTKFAGAMKGMVSNIAGGGNVWESILQGIEHNGISRPLAGLAQTLQATTGNGVPYSTTGKGDIMFSNDLLSFATLARLSGARPLDEAIINDGLYRDQGYAQVNKDRMQGLADAIKTTGINGQTASGDQVSQFAQKYAEEGGKQIQFNQFMMKQIKESNTSQADLIVHQLQNPFNQKMQLLMGTMNASGALGSLSTPPSGSSGSSSSSQSTQ